MKIHQNYNLRKYNTFDIDVECRYFVESDREEDFLDFVSNYDMAPSELLVLGAGSNFLFTENFDGTIFYPTMNTIEIVDEDMETVQLRVGAGLDWDQFVNWCVEHNYAGAENLSYIPGHVGASPVQNVGAYGVEAKDIIYGVEAINIESAQKDYISNRECEFGYRDSRFKREWKNKYIVTYVHFKLAKCATLHLEYGGVRQRLEQMEGELSITKVRKAIIDIRQEKLPEVADFPNAGSFFKNPIVSRDKAEQLKRDYPTMPTYPLDNGDVKLAAGWLVEQTGWKGKAYKGAGVHKKQALVLVNLGEATGEQVAYLANEIKKSVFLTFGIFLEPEVYII